MTAKSKSIAIIVGTLLVGAIIGSLATGAVFSQRVAELQALRSENGLTPFLERVIEPTDDAQKKQIRAVLEKSARRQMEIRRSIAAEHREVFEEMREELSQILTDEQKAALRAWIETDRRQRRRLPPPDMMRRPGDPRFDRAPFDSTERRRPWRRRLEADETSQDSTAG